MRFLLASLLIGAPTSALAASPVDDFRAAITSSIKVPFPDERYSVRLKESPDTRPVRERHLRLLNALAPGVGFRIGIGGVIDMRGQRDYTTSAAAWMKLACSSNPDFSGAMLRWSVAAEPFRKFTTSFDALMGTLERDAKTKHDPRFVQFFASARAAQNGLNEIVRGQSASVGAREAILSFMANCGVR